MILVAVVAIGIWAATSVPRAINQTIAYHARAEYEAYLERTARAFERDSSSRAGDIQSQFDQWRRVTEAPDEITERYFNSRREFYAADAEYQHAMAAYHAGLKTKYRWAKWFPLVSAEPDRAPPPDPLKPAPVEREAGKTYQFVSEGGISAAFSPGGTGLAVGCRDRTIRLLELPSRSVRASFSLTEGEPHSLEFSPDGTTLFAVGDGLVVRRWKVAAGRAERSIPWIDHSAVSLDFASAICCSPDARTIAVAAGGFEGKAAMGQSLKRYYSVRLLDTRTGALLWEHKGSGSPPYSVAFSPDGGTLACGTGTVEVLNSRTGMLKHTLKPVIGHAIAVAFAPDGRTLAGAGADILALGVGARGGGRVTLWDSRTSEILRTLEGPSEAAFEVAFSPDGRTIVAGGRGPSRNGRDPISGSRAARNTSEVRAWDAATGKLMWTTEGESNSAYSLSFSHDGKSLAFCDEDYVYVVDSHAGRLKQIVMETTSTVRAQDRRPQVGRR